MAIYNASDRSSPYKMEDASGRTWWQITAHAALTAKTPYMIVPGADGFITAAVPDNALAFRIGVPDAAVASGAEAWIQTGGYCASMVTASIDVDTAGHMIKMDNAVTADAGATFVASVFAVSTVANAAGAKTTYNVLLLDREVTCED